MSRTALVVGLIFSFRLFATEPGVDPLNFEEALRRLNVLFSRENPNDSARPSPVTVGTVAPDPRNVRLEFGYFNRVEKKVALLTAARSEYVWKYDENKKYLLVPDIDGVLRRKILLLPLKLDEVNGVARMILFPEEADSATYAIYPLGERGIAWKDITQSPSIPNAEIEHPIVEFGTTRIFFDEKGSIVYALEMKLYSLSPTYAAKLEVKKEGKPVLNDQRLKTYQPIKSSEVESLVKNGDLIFEKDETGFNYVQVE